MDRQIWIRPNVQALRPYTPGEQPQDPSILKLNTNENPYPPSPHVLETVRAAVDGRLRLYPNPTADRLREKLAQLYGCRPEHIIVGNGSDELLAMACRAFVDPCGGSKQGENLDPRSLVQYFDPGYSLYPVLAQIHGAQSRPVPLEEDFQLPDLSTLERQGQWKADAALTYLTTPNAPSGRGYPTSQVERVCQQTQGILVLDEAYAEFGEENAIKLAQKYSHVIVSRTFSKAYSLCFLRVGYFIGPKALIEALHKIRDSYNVNGLGQIAAEATLEDLDYYRANFQRIRQVRDEVRQALEAIGFSVFPSWTNFLFAKPPVQSARWWFEALRRRGILVRWFDLPRVRDRLRITIGTAEQMERFLQVVKELLGEAVQER